MESGRMGELVDALALSSSAMVGMPPSKKRLAHGARLDIWNIKLEGKDDKSDLS
jgi:hypothetical protein